MQNSFLSHFFLVFFGLLSLHFPAKALEVPAPTGRYANDFASLLKQETLSEIESVLRNHETQTQNQVALAIFPSLKNEALEDFSLRLAERWKIGQKGQDNGALFLIFVQDRKMRIEVGYGLEDKLTDAHTSQILSREVTPAFKQGDLDLGVKLGIKAILLSLDGQYKLAKPQTAKKAPRWLLFVAILFFIIFSQFMQFLNIHSPVIVSGRGRGGGFGGGGFGGGGFGGGGFSGGGGGFGGGGSNGSW